jgi:hypothetical protein
MRIIRTFLPRIEWNRKPEIEVRSFSRVLSAWRMRSKDVDFQQNST